jgi:cytochrome b561
MTAAYCLLALAIAFSLSHGNRAVRAVGTLLVALSLVMIIASILLADFDGTFARVAPASAGLERCKPLMLNIGAGVATIATLFLLWAAWRQAHRTPVERLLLSNTESTFGLISRYAHWITAALMLCLIPMGLFMSVLPAGSADRDAYTVAHESLGMVVLGIAVIRLGWLAMSPPPRAQAGSMGWEIPASFAAHIALYVLIVAFPVSGLLMEAARGERPTLGNWALPTMPAGLVTSLDWPLVHDWVAPGLLCVVLGLHIGAVVKHHFFGRRGEGMPRMLR